MPKNELYIYDVIGKGWLVAGVTGDYVRTELASFDKSEPVSVHIDSPGGSINAGRTIYSLLSGWAAGVNVVVDGQASSAASLIAMAGSTITMAEGSLMMIHDPWTEVTGGAEQLRQAADVLDGYGEELAKTYSKRTGIDVDQVKQMMADETWMFADEAVARGFADSVQSGLPAAAFSIPEGFNYRHPPQKPQPPRQRAANSIAQKERELRIYRHLA